MHFLQGCNGRVDVVPPAGYPYTQLHIQLDNPCPITAIKITHRSQGLHGDVFGSLVGTKACLQSADGLLVLDAVCYVFAAVPRKVCWRGWRMIV